MGYNSYTTADLIDQVKLLSHSPLSQLTFTDANILQLANFELQTAIMKMLLSTRGGYYLTFEDLDPISTGLYSLPAQASGVMLANVELIQDTTIIQVNIIVESEQFATNSPTSTSYGAFLRGNYIQILPTPNVGHVRLWYFRRPSQLVVTTTCAEVEGIAGNVISVDNVPGNFFVGAFLDALGDNPPFNVLYESAEITNIVGQDITLSVPIPDLQIDDWLALHDQTCVPQLPIEFSIVLVQRVVCKWYELQGDLDKLKAARASLEEYQNMAVNLITPRIQSQTKIINPVNGGFLGSVNKVNIFPPGKNS